MSRVRYVLLEQLWVENVAIRNVVDLVLNFLTQGHVHVHHVFLVAKLGVACTSVVLRKVALVHVNVAHHTSTFVWPKVFHSAAWSKSRVRFY